MTTTENQPPLDLDALAAREAAATPGPWKHAKTLAHADENLIVALRNAAPALIAAAREVARLREWKAEAMEVAGWWEETWVAAGRPGWLGRPKSEGVRAHVVLLTAERDAAQAALARVEALHQREDMATIAADCINADCEHEDECPSTGDVPVCKHCSGLTGFFEAPESFGPVFWPCPTATAIAGAVREAGS